MKTIPFDEEQLRLLAKEYGTPVYLYDQAGIEGAAQTLKASFSWAKGYKNYFAVKATPTPKILTLLKEQSMGFDCSSITELEMVERLGISGEDIFFTSNNTTKEAFEKAITLGAIINIDDIVQIPVFLDALNGRKYNSVAVRYNPGDDSLGNDIIGKPKEAKFGMTKDQILLAFKQFSAASIERFGLHAMIASNELEPAQFQRTAELLKDVLTSVNDEGSASISFMNLGGGLGVNYLPSEQPVDVAQISKMIQGQLENLGIEIYTENGRYVTGPHGYLLTEVRYIMQKHKTYASVDASMHNLMRPGMYGSYHHISLVGDAVLSEQTYDITGSLCENNDKFALDRQMPELSAGDLLVIHDAGAHGHSMGFNYNGLLRSAEVLVDASDKASLIRRAETLDDHFAPLVW